MKFLALLIKLLKLLLMLLKIKYLVLVIKKSDYNTNINEIEKKISDDKHDKYITEINKLTLENFATRLKQANLLSKSGIANFVNKIDLDNKL